MAKSKKDFKRVFQYTPQRNAQAKKLLPLVIGGLVLAIALGGFLLYKSTKQALHSMEAPPEDHSSYLALTPGQTPGGKWAEAFLQVAPSGMPAWKVTNNSGPGQPVPYEACANLGLPPQTLLSLYAAQGKNGSEQALVYQAGTAPQAYAQFKQQLSKCFTLKTTNLGSPKTEVASWANGAFFTYGDSIVFLQSTQNGLVAQDVPAVVAQASKTLQASSCASLTVSPQDITRNIYASGKSYTGLVEKETLNTKVKLTQLPTVVFPSIKNVTYADAPEGPLSPLIPSVPKAPSKPSVPQDYNAPLPKFTQSISYKVQDVTGPGCGWRWTSLQPAQEDVQALKAHQAQLQESTQSSLDGSARTYVDKKIETAADYLITSQNIDAWNTYVEQVATVQDKWKWLENQRATIYPAWMRYVWAHDTWLNFDNTKANALKAYNAAVDACNQANSALAAWHQQWDAVIASQPTAPITVTPPPVEVTSTVTPPAPAPTVSIDPSTKATTTVVPTATPTIVVSTSQPPLEVTTPTPTVQVPEAPQGCTQAPTKPAILDQAKGSEPQSPPLPQAVTIPDSWQKPLASPSVPLQ